MPELGLLSAMAHGHTKTGPGEAIAEGLLPVLAGLDSDRAGLYLRSRIDAAAKEVAKEESEKAAKEGLERGLERGLEQGLERQRKLLQAQLEKKFGALSEEMKVRLSSAGFERLTEWALRFVEVDELEAVFEGE